MCRWRFVSAMFILVAFAATAGAQIPTNMSYQGVLTDGSGAPVADGNHSLVFKLYSVSTGGAALWTETQPTVNTTTGVLSVTLGSVTPIGIAFDGALWLGIEVDGGGELTPRIELTTSPYAFQAKSVDDDAVTSAKIADGTIAVGDIAGSQVVTSVNTLTDAVTLAQGANVTITPAGNTLTIASTAAGGNSLDMAYDEGGAGAGKLITADNGAVDIAGADGLTVAGMIGAGTTTPTAQLDVKGAGTSAATVAFNVTDNAGASIIHAKDDGGIGLGFTAPVAGSRLTIKATADNTNDFILQKHDATTQIVQIGESSGSGLVSIKDFTSNSLNHWLEGGDGSWSSLAVQPNARIGVGVNSPATKFEVEGGSVLFDGTVGGTPVSGAGTRLMWIPAKGAFRAGKISGTEWDDANVGANSTITGGEDNAASGAHATVGGGINNAASGQHGTVSGGEGSLAGGISSTVPGGKDNEASGNYSFAAGQRAKANHAGAFVWADQTAADFTSTAADQFLIRASGGVGIGTASPGQLLDVAAAGLPSGAGDEKANIRAYNAGDAIHFGHSNGVGIGALGALSTNGAPYLQFWAYHSDLASAARSTGAYEGRIIGDSGANDNVFEFSSGNNPGADIPVVWTPRMVINQNGNVGIGTQIPAEQLDVDGGQIRLTKTGAISLGATFGGILNFDSAGGTLGIASNSTGGNTAIDFMTSTSAVATTKMRIDNAGNVGIGTTSPGQLLDLHNAGSAGTVYPLRLVNNTTAVAGTGVGIEFGFQAGSQILSTIEAEHTGGSQTDLIFSTQNGAVNENMRILGNGNVGIGTSSPLVGLDVIGDPNGAVRIGSNETDATAKTMNLVLQEFTNANGHLLVIDGQTNNTANIVRIGGGYAGYDAATEIGFYTAAAVNTDSGTERMRIDVNGNVGIGTGSLNEKLNVAGHIAPSGDNTYTLGTGALRWSDVYAVSGTVNTSDRRAKENIEDITHGLEEVKSLRPVSYTWKDSPERGTKLGLIAQEVQPVVKEVVHVGDDEDQTLGLYYSDLIPVLIKAVQEQQEIIDGERAGKAELSARLDRATKELEAVKAQMTALTDAVELVKSSMVMDVSDNLASEAVVLD